MKRFIKMTLGQVLYSLAITITIQANIGFCPWDVFHSGIANLFGVTIGNAITIISVVLFVVALFKKWPIGIGTIMNVFVCGTLVDVFRGIIPAVHGWIPGIAMFVLGIIVLAFATYCYIEPAYGTSVRDSLFVFISKKLNIATAKARIVLEVSLVVLGLLMGGSAGLGSVLSCIITGPCMQIMFKLLKFELVKVRHENLVDSWRKIQARK